MPIFHTHYPLALVFLFGACVNAEAATDLTLAGVFGFLKSLLAAEATFLEVCSFVDFLVAIITPELKINTSKF